MSKMTDPEIAQAVGKQVMDLLNEAGAMIATMGHSQQDGTYEFLLGPVYLPREKVKIGVGEETAPRQLLVSLKVVE